MVQDVLDELEGKMKRTAESLRHHLATVRTGRASTALVDQLQVEADGAHMALNQLANITVPDARMLIIQPFDGSTIKAIERAIQHSELGINPSNDGRIIRLVLPPLTEERRRDLTKQVRARVEDPSGIDRSLRRSALDDLRQFEQEKLISEDEQRRGQERVQEMTDRFGRDLDHIGTTKEAEVMEI